MSLRIGFIGGGNMAEAMIAAVLKAEITPPANVIVSRRSAAELHRLSETYSVKTTPDNNVVCRLSEVVIIAVKPQVVQGVLAELKFNPKALYISVVGGCRLEMLEKHLKGCRVVRVMPNTPAMVGCCASGYVLGSTCSDEENELTKGIMEACGITHKIANENQMDVVCGLAGSGPAYVYMMIEALSDAGVKGGLPRAVSTDLATNVVLGAAQMVKENNEHPAVLRNMVESPGGTTIAGTTTLEQHGFRNAVIQAVSAATNRSFELGQL